MPRKREMERIRQRMVEDPEFAKEYAEKKAKEAKERRQRYKQRAKMKALGMT